MSIAWVVLASKWDYVKDKPHSMHRHRSRHHLVPKERKKDKTDRQNQVNLHIDATFILWRDKHDSWHHLFKNMTLDEIIECLQRVKWLCLRKQSRSKKVIPMNQSYFTKIQP